MTQSQPRDPRAEKPASPSPGLRVPDDKAAAVLAGARDVFLSHGFNAATTDMIQRAAGVSKATVYAKYPTKEALFSAVIEAECERLLVSVRASEQAAQSVQEALTHIGRSYLQLVLSPFALGLYRAVIADAPRFPALARRFYLAGPGRIIEMVAEQLDRAALAGEVDLGTVGRAAAAAAFVNLVRGEPQMQSLTHPEAVASAAQRDQWVLEAVTIFMSAFGSRHRGRKA